MTISSPKFSKMISGPEAEKTRSSVSDMRPLESLQSAARSRRKGKIAPCVKRPRLQARHRWMVSRKPGESAADRNPEMDEVARPALPRILVIGDVMTDVIVRPEGPLARGSDRRARIALRDGCSAAN